MSLHDKILTPPTNTDELIKLENFIINTKDNVFIELQKQSNEILSCQFFLSNFITLTEDELTENTNTFVWIKRIDKVLIKSTITINDKTIQFKEVLRDRINMFNTELKKYKSEVEEMVDYGNINEINMYVEKSRNLDKKLIEAITTIDEINKEEKYFQINESIYPLRKMVRIKYF